MNQFPSSIKFKYSWRTYQQRILQELDKHLLDEHLHVVAPPGSGKTVLGLEVMLRLNKPTLIVTPTIAIRNQWIHRFCDLFLQEKNPPEWISSDIRAPKFLTIVTYQAVYSADVSKENPGNIIQLLQEKNIGTIVLDEAHHLKNNWWKALSKLKKNLKATIVGLTATPPYDVSLQEWQRYMNLNGPVDAEISIPELVLEENLCPHQDYVMFSTPSQNEAQEMGQHRAMLHKLFVDIKNDQVLINAIEEHPFHKAPLDHLDEIYENVECYSSMLIFLNSLQRELSEAHFEIIGANKLDIPDLDLEWMEVLLDFYLHKDDKYLGAFEEHKTYVIKKLKRHGVLEKKTIHFKDSKKIKKILLSGINKLNSIKQIVDVEYGQLQHQLRMVILTDFIRKEFFVEEVENTLELNKIGVMPIFEKLRRTNQEGVKIGVLTGSLVIIPLSALEELKRKFLHDEIRELSIAPLPFDKNYVVVQMSGKRKDDLVHMLTDIFQKGLIEVLVGTKSLLGEGWDAPAINALILASFVGSYVLSNQMRGRAIRSDINNKDKTSHIWHLVSVDLESPEGGYDVQLLQRRFEAFVGVSLKSPRIESGFDRMNITKDLQYSSMVFKINDRMIQHALNRNALKEKWTAALNNGAKLVKEIKINGVKSSSRQKREPFFYNKTIAYLFALLVSGIAAFLKFFWDIFIDLSRYIKSLDEVYGYLILVGVAGVVLFGGKIFKIIRLHITYRDIAKDITQISRVLLKTLAYVQLPHTDYSKVDVVAKSNGKGEVFCHLKGGSVYENSVFIKAMEDIVSSINNPRYIIIRKSTFFKLKQQRDYHAVPDVIGSNKEFAEYFKEEWAKHVGRCELVYVRTKEGRKRLLQFRLQSLSSEFDKHVSEVNAWR